MIYQQIHIGYVSNQPQRGNPVFHTKFFGSVPKLKGIGNF